MGLKMRIISLFGSFLFILLQISCNTIFDDHKQCMIDLSMRFILQSPCNNTPKYISRLTDVVFLSFDEHGKYLGQSRMKEYDFEKNSHTALSIHTNSYRTYIWSGVSEIFDKEKIKSEDDVYLLLKSSHFSELSTDLNAVYFGHFQSQEAIKNITANYFDVYLQEITNRIEIDLEFDDSSSSIDINDFELILKSANGVYHANGKMPSDQDFVTYTPEVLAGANHATYLYKILDIKAEQSNAVVLVNKKTGNIILEADLIESIILKNESINLECVNDFKLKFVLGSLCKDCDTYTCVKIIVNDWLVYSYDIQLGRLK